MPQQLAQLEWPATPVFVINGLRREELIAANSAWLHELCFDNLGGDGQLPDCGPSIALERDFGSVERWRAEFTALAKAMGGGSGWPCCRGRRAKADCSTTGRPTTRTCWPARRRCWPSRNVRASAGRCPFESANRVRARSPALSTGTPRHSGHRRRRRTQLVAGIGHEAALGLEGPFDAVEPGVERGCEARDLVVRTAGANTPAQVPAVWQAFTEGCRGGAAAEVREHGKGARVR